MITPQQARAELARRELARRELARREQAVEPDEIIPPEKAPSIGRFGAGGVGYGAEAVSKGLGFRDIPHIVAKAVSGAGYGMPERIAKRPLKFGLSGTVGVGLDPYSREEDWQLPFPKAASRGGEMIGNVAEILGGAAPTERIISNLPKFASKAGRAVQRFGQLRKQGKEAQVLAEELLGGAEKARKKVGSSYEEFINLFGDQPINSESTTDLLKNLPKQIIQELRVNKNIEKIVDDLGRTVIQPTLKNAKIIRDIVRGKVSSKFWNPKLVQEPEKQAADFVYEELGKIMREGRPDLKSIMQAYAEARTAGKELYPALRTSTGFTKTKPIMRMFEKGAEGSKQQAVEALSKYNPEILQTVEKIRKFAGGVNRSKILSNVGKRLGAGALFGLGGTSGYKLFR